MEYVCAQSPGWRTGAGLDADLAAVLPAALAEASPRVRLEPRRVWVDGRGLPGDELANAVRTQLAAVGVRDARLGMAAVPIAAALAARIGQATTAKGDEEAPTMHVEPGGERAFLAPLPLAWLDDACPRVLSLLEGVGIERCGELAALEAAAVEVRFGAEGVRLQRLARAHDPRRLFGRMPREHPRASVDFPDYSITDPERLIFAASALLGTVCDDLRARGEHARRMTLRLALEDGGEWSRSLGTVRPTARRAVWLRCVRRVLERLSVPAAVEGVGVEVEATGPAGVRQGDLFDRGFATASAVEAAVLRLLDSQGEVVVRPETNGHPLADRRTRWAAEDPSAAERPAAEAGEEMQPVLTLQLLPEPREVRVVTASRRGRAVPVRYRDRNGWRTIVRAAGPDRVSGGRWAEAYAREYFRCVREDGLMVWLFRDGLRDAWRLHGWWD